MIEFPWKLVEDKTLIESNSWMMAALMDKGIPLKYVKEPDKDTIKRLHTIFQCLNSNRNFILIVSNKTAYINSLFYYVAATWLTTTNRNFEIIDLNNVVEDDTILFKMEHANLLIIPYNDSENYKLRNIRNALGSILLKRQIKSVPTIIELYVKQPPKGMPNKDLVGLLKNLANLYGEQCASTFIEKESNVKLLVLG